MVLPARADAAAWGKVAAQQLLCAKQAHASSDLSTSHSVPPELEVSVMVSGAVVLSFSGPRGCQVHLHLGIHAGACKQFISLAHMMRTLLVGCGYSNVHQIMHQITTSCCWPAILKTFFLLSLLVALPQAEVSTLAAHSWLALQPQVSSC
jgi:hypothetical protein